jgi:hypothetical protein
MPVSPRLARAVAAATKYAPKPQGSSLLYGLIAVAVLAIAMTAAGRFYAIDFLSFPVSVAIGGAAAFVFGVLLRGRRARAHRAAVDDEYDRSG